MSARSERQVPFRIPGPRLNFWPTSFPTLILGTNIDCISFSASQSHHLSTMPDPNLDTSPPATAAPVALNNPQPTSSLDTPPIISKAPTSHPSGSTATEPAAEPISEPSRPPSRTSTIERPASPHDPCWAPPPTFKERVHNFRRAFTTARATAKTMKQNEKTITHRLKELLDSTVADLPAAIAQLNTIVDEAVGLALEEERVYEFLVRLNWGHLMQRQKVDWLQVGKGVRSLREQPVGNGNGLRRVERRI